MKIELSIFPPLPNLPNASPFCMKLEAYLRMVGLEYTVRPVHDGRRSGTGTNKVPYVTIDQQSYSDSGLIIDQLEAIIPNPIDADLSPRQRAEALAMQRLLEEHLYWVIVYSRVLDPDGWQGWSALANEHLGVPRLLLTLVRPLLRRRVTSHLHSQGVGRHTAATIWELGERDVAAVATWLGDRTWAFGDQPHLLDACIASFTGAVIRMPWEYPLKQAYEMHPNLERHFDRFMLRYFPECP